MKLDAALLLLAGMHAAVADDVTLVWTVQAYDDMTATVGDTVTFDFTSGHTVHVHPSGDCENTDAVELGTEGPVMYTFTEDDVGDIFFACEVDSHCDNGQIVKFTVTAAGSEGATPTISPQPSQPGEAVPAPPSDGGSGPSNPAPAPTSEGGPSPPSATAPASVSSSKGMVLAHVLLLIGAGMLN